MVPFAGVVVDHVQDHLESVAVQRPHHAFEFVDRRLRTGIGGEAQVRREESQ